MPGLRHWSRQGIDRTVEVTDDRLINPNIDKGLMLLLDKWGATTTAGLAAESPGRAPPRLWRLDSQLLSGLPRRQRREILEICRSPRVSEARIPGHQPNIRRSAVVRR